MKIYCPTCGGTSVLTILEGPAEPEIHCAICGSSEAHEVCPGDEFYPDIPVNIGDTKTLVKELERYKQWVNDLQAGMYINCVYCGHRYGPDTEVPASMADVLKEHIEVCPEHPMSQLLQQTDLAVLGLSHIWDDANHVLRSAEKEDIDNGEILQLCDVALNSIRDRAGELIDSQEDEYT